MNTVKQMWDTTIEYFKQGDSDLVAMGKIYDSMQSPLSNQDLSDVFSAVYANSYWNVVYMDYSKLSNSLVSTTNISKDEANTISKKSFSYWTGILTRNSSLDAGKIPKDSSDYTCIDLICNGSTESLPSLFIKNWNTPVWYSPQVGKNYVYTRCQNLDFFGDLSDSDDLYPKVRMFATDAGFNLPPSSWVELYTVNAPTKTEGKVMLIDNEPGPMPEGTRGCSEAFFFNPTSTNPVCVISTIGTRFFTNPLNNLGGNWDAATWINCNGAAGIHNASPQQTKSIQLAFHNQDDSAENFVFKIMCFDVPINSTITLKNKDQSLTFSSDDFIVNNPFAQFESSVCLPANYAGKLTISVKDTQGNLLPKNAIVQINMLWRLDLNHERFSDSLLHFKIAKDVKFTDLSVGSFTLFGERNTKKSK